MIGQLEQELIEQGKNPNDFNIRVTENGHTITPKWFYETKQIAKKEDKPIKEDIDVTAETVVYTTSDVADLAETVVVSMEDSLTMAETVSQLMMEIDELKQELEEIKNG